MRLPRETKEKMPLASNDMSLGNWWKVPKPEISETTHKGLQATHSLLRGSVTVYHSPR